jgi:cell wall-associated NlpC family hydrolase
MASRLIFITFLNLALVFSPHLAKADTLKGITITGGNDQVMGLTAVYLENHSNERFFRSSGPSPVKPTERLVARACHYLHTPYRWGSSLRTGRATDCSGFVQYIYRKVNISLPRASFEQAHVGKVAARTMDFAKLQAGDLLFFRDGGHHIGHVGIYLGAGKMIHASDHRHGVVVSDLHEPYYRSNFVVAKRLLQETPGGPSSTRLSSGSVTN